MSAAVRFLAGFCREHPLDEKIFVAPSFVAGRQIGDALAREAGSWINLRFVTIPALAAEVLEKCGDAGAAKPMTSSAELALTDRLVRELAAAGELAYLGRGGVSPGLVAALHRALRDLRLDGRSSADIRPERFLVERKGRELVRLAESYERALDAGGLLDLPGLLDRAARAAARTPFGSAWVLGPADTRLSRLETRLVRIAAAGRLVFVPGDPVVGLDRPSRCWPWPGSPDLSGAGRLSWLFAPGQAPPPEEEAQIGIFRAVGPANECREILRRLYAEKIPFDHVEVLAPPGSVHPNVFHLIAARTGLPVTFGEGIPVSFTSPGRLFFGLIDWLENDFSSTPICRLIENGDLILTCGPSATPLAARTACRLLRNAMIGWGRDRYIDRLEALREGKKADLAALAAGEANEELEEAEGRRAGYLEAIAEIDDLSAGIGRILELIPRPGASGATELRLLCEAFSKIMAGYARTGSDLDRRARQVLLGRLGEFVSDNGLPPLSLKEALDLIRTAGASLRVGASPPLPGHLHVAGISSGGYSGRAVTFVVGLDEATFPGRGLQDPILLDEERIALSESLPTSADDLHTNLFGLAAALASLRGRVVLSYPSYDIVEGRESFPSSVVLQAFRLLRGDPGLDYAALDRGLAEAAGFLPGTSERVFDELDWWLDRLVGRDPAPDGAGSVAANFPDLAAGLAAASARAAETLTPYEGIVDIGPLRAEVDPLAGEKAVMSATRLELLAKCPFAYFLRHVLKVLPPEEVVFDRSRWLDPLQRGTLIHEILCAFMTEATKSGDDVAAARHAPLMARLAGEKIVGMRRKVPPPSESIFESERKDLLETLAIFLATEERRDEKGRPLEFEKKIEAEAIDLGGERSFRLRGSIDRVDGLGENAYRILDYKTGSPADYEELVEFGHGQKIQHALYAVALEKILARQGQGKARVTRSGYMFPSRRGEGLERIIKSFDRDRLRSLLGALLGLLQKGYFIAGPEARCAYCDYAAVCVSGGPEAMAGKKKVLLQLLALIEDGCLVAGIRTGGSGIDPAAGCGGHAGKAKKRIEASLRIFKTYDKLGEYK